jgi:hypothetical protein
MANANARAPILALDIATRTGWAYGQPGSLPRSGSVAFAPPGSNNGVVARGLILWLIDFLAVSPVSKLYYEVPLDPRFMGKKTNFNTARVLIGLPLVAEGICEMRGVYRRREVSVQDVRQHFLGVRRPPDPKAAVMARCRQLRWNPVDHNAGDALALWDFACAVEEPGAGIATTPLFTPPPEPAPVEGEPEDIPF